MGREVGLIFIFQMDVLWTTAQVPVERRPLGSLPERLGGPWAVCVHMCGMCSQHLDIGAPGGSSGVSMSPLPTIPFPRLFEVYPVYLHANRHFLKSDFSCLMKSVTERVHGEWSICASEDWGYKRGSVPPCYICC